MKLSEIKTLLSTVETVNFVLENGTQVPVHFHVTEVGEVTKHFIDCGGTVRHEKKVNFQLWEANDFDHRLSPAKLLNIINLSEKTLGIGDSEIEVEYQSETIGKYSLGFNGKDFVLQSTHTNCLAKDSCGIPEGKLVKPRYKISEIQSSACCTPGGGCC